MAGRLGTCPNSQHFSINPIRKMKKNIIVCGLGYGDEGKGATVDALARKTGASWVVRYSSGYQAGHNVVLPDGRSHTFSQFGAGTFARAMTFLGREFAFCPFALDQEAEHLKTLGIANPYAYLRISHEALLVTPIHRMLNRFKTLQEDHGSCMMGVGAVRGFLLTDGRESCITLEDILESPTLAYHKMALLKERAFEWIGTHCFNRNDQLRAIARDLHELSPKKVAKTYSDLAQTPLAGCLCYGVPRPDESETIIFEGSQGLLLDEYIGFHPNTTWATVSPEPAIDMVDEFRRTLVHRSQIEVIGVTRAYSTRHGLGPFPSALTEEDRTAGLFAGFDTHNQPNSQGVMRVGYLDLPLLKYAINSTTIDTLAVTCLDQVPEQVPVISSYAERTPPPSRGFRGNGQPRSFPTSSTYIHSHSEVFGSELNEETWEPVKQTRFKEQLIRDLCEIRPIRVLSDGPTYENRKWIE